MVKMKLRSIMLVFLFLFTLSILVPYQTSAEDIINDEDDGEEDIEHTEESSTNNEESKSNPESDNNEEEQKVEETEEEIGSDDNSEALDEELPEEEQPSNGDKEEISTENPNQVKEDSHVTNDQESEQEEEVNEDTPVPDTLSENSSSRKLVALKKGVRDPEVKELKRKLNQIGFGGITVTDYFGDFTDRRVREFQAYYNLEVDGSAGPATMKKLDEVYNSPFQGGKRHKETIALKNKLNKLDFGYIQVTELYGSFTTKKVKEFQKTYGLIENGIADERTVAKIDELLSSPLQHGKNHNDMIEIKQKLNHLNYGKITVTTLLGNITEKNVVKFQKDNNIPAHEIIDPLTLNKIDSVFNNAFKKNNRHPGIVAMKNKLNKIGFGNITVTTLYGSFTEKKVKEFQQYYGITVTGQADLKTLNMLDQVHDSPFQQGKRHEDTIDLKNNLNELGFGNITVTTLYGSFTAKRVRDFQKHYGLKVNGIADPPTLNKIDELLSDPLQVGDRDNSLINIKKKLNSLGYGHITVTTLFGSYTEQKVKEFQADEGLPVSGSIDGNTLNKINQTYSSVFKQGGRHPSIIDLKHGLNKVGFGYISVTTLYGSFTQQQVKKFQKHYGLQVTGEMDLKTFDKLNSILSSPYQRGKRHEDMIELKTKLNEMGYGNISLTTLFGSFTESQVKKFQADKGLPVSGIIDDETYDKIMEGINVDNTQYDITLNDALNIQMNNAPQTDKYSGKAAYVSAKYVDITDHSAINSTGNVNLRTSPSLKNNNNVAKSAKNGDKITILGEVKGDSHQGSTKWYKINYKNDKTTLYVHSSLVSTSSTAKVNGNVNVRSGSNTSSHIYGQLTKGTTVTIVSKGSNWHQIRYKTWRNPTRNDVESYLNPNNNDEFQHLVLS